MTPDHYPALARCNRWNHLLLADRVWTGRFTGVSLQGDWLCADFDELRRERGKTDQEIGPQAPLRGHSRPWRAVFESRDVIRYRVQRHSIGRGRPPRHQHAAGSGRSACRTARASLLGQPQPSAEKC